MKTITLLKNSSVLLLSVTFIAACSSTPKVQEPEVAAAVAPLVPPTPPKAIINTPRGPSLTLSDVLFDFEESSLRPEATATIKQAADYLQQNPRRIALVEGHADATGDAGFNQSLSEARASSIKNALIEQGVSESRINTVGLGESQPVATNETLDGRQANRRVEIIFKKDKSF